MVAASDHYVWRDMDTFVGIVADAGEWTIDLDRIKAAYKEAKEDGCAAVFKAPLYVVKAYVKELQDYGLIAGAELVETQEEAEEEEEQVWSSRDWQELGPDAKEASVEAKAVAEQEEKGQKARVWIIKNDQPSFQTAKNSNARFNAYIELAADAAKKFAPEEPILNAAYAQIMGSSGRALVLDSLSEEAAAAANEQLEAAGFKVEIEIYEKK